jgi:hypothetical protein
MSKKGGDDGQAAQARADEMQRQERIRSGTQRVDDIFKQNFNDDFYANRQKSFLDYATPQLEDQYGTARKQLTFALDRAGTSDSSIRAQKEGELQKLYDSKKQAVADQALSYKSQAQGSVEDARSNLVSMLNATGDAEGAANSAISRSQALSTPPTYSALGSLFTDFTSALGTQAAAERATAMSGPNGAYKSPYNTGLFGNLGSVKVTA